MLYFTKSSMSLHNWYARLPWDIIGGALLTMEEVWFGNFSLGGLVSSLRCIIPCLFSGKVKVVLESQDMFGQPIRVLGSAVILFFHLGSDLVTFLL